jgi:hypothetical protein
MGASIPLPTHLWTCPHACAVSGLQLIPKGELDAAASEATEGLVDPPFPSPTKADVGVRSKASGMANTLASLRSGAEGVQQKSLRTGALVTSSMLSVMTSVASGGGGAGAGAGAGAGPGAGLASPSASITSPLPAYLSLAMSSSALASPTASLFSPLSLNRKPDAAGRLQPLRPVGLAGGTMEVGGQGGAGRLQCAFRCATFIMCVWRKTVVVWEMVCFRTRRLSPTCSYTHTQPSPLPFRPPAVPCSPLLVSVETLCWSRRPGSTPPCSRRC